MKSQPWSRKRLFGVSLLVAGIVLISVLWGCGGGGGGSAGPADVNAESAAIKNRIQGFLASLGKGTAVSEYLSPRLQSLTADGETLTPLTVYDLGETLTTTSDDRPYNFFFDPADIVFLSADAALVPTWIDLSSGNRFRLNLHLLKFDGVWYIDNLDFQAQSPEALAAAGGPIPATALFPLTIGNKINSVRLPLGTASDSSGPLADFVLTSIGDQTVGEYNGLPVYSLDRSEFRAPLTVDASRLGVATDQMRFGTTGLSIRRSGFPELRPVLAVVPNPLGEIARILDPFGLGRVRFANTLGLMAFGADANFNSGEPWRLTSQLARDGTALSQTISFLDRDGTRRTAEMRSQFMGTVQVNLPWGLVSGIRLDVSALLADNGEDIRETWMFVPGVGLVAIVFYDETTGLPDGQLCLLAARVNNRQFGNPQALPGSPVVLSHLVPASWPTVGVAFQHSFQASGGTPPYAWTLAYGPTWFHLDALGRASGVPDQPGSFPIGISLADSARQSTRRDILWVVAAGLDTTPPIVASFLPASGAAGIPATTAIVLQFNEPVNASSVVSALAVTAQPGGAVSLLPASVGSGGSVLTFQPTSPLPFLATVSVTLASGIGDAQGNLTTQPFGWTFSVVGPPPVPASVAVDLVWNDSGSLFTNAAAINVTASSSSPITDFALTSLALQNAQAGNLVGSFPTASWTFTVTPAGPGTVTVGLAGNAIHDQAGGGNAAVTIQRVFDPQPPAGSFVSSAPATVAAGPVSIVASFSEPIQNFSLALLAVVNGSTGNLVSLTPGRSWSFDLNPTGPGTFSVTLASGAVLDLAGNGNPQPLFLARTLDSGIPVAQLLISDPDPTASSPIVVTASFSEPVTGFALTSVTPTNGTVANLVPVASGQIWTFDLIPVSNGLVQVSLPANAVTDLAGNGNNGPVTVGRTFDGAQPIAQLLISDPNPTASSPIVVTASFSETVTGFTLTSVTPTNGTVANLVPVASGQIWTFDLIPVSDGLVQVSLPANAVADLAGNGSTGPVTAGRTFDGTRPVAQLFSATADPTNVAPIPVTASFSETVSGFTLADLTATNGLVSNLVQVTPGRVWTFDINPTSAGLVQVSLASDAVADPAGNGNLGSVSLSRNFNASGPLAQLLSTSPDPTNSGPIPVTASFSVPVTGFSLADLTPTNGVVSNLVETVASQTWTFDLTPSGDGPTQVSLAANAAFDGAGNGNPGPVVLSRVFDGTAPVAQLLSAAPDPANSSPIPVTASFSEVVGGFSLTDLTVVNGTVSNLVPITAGQVWTFDLTPSGEGLVQVTLPANVATDSANNANAGSVTLARTYDSIPPVAQLTSVAPDPTNAAPIVVTASFSETVSGFALGDLTTANGAVSNLVNVTPGRVWTFDLNPSGNGLVQVTLPANVATDSANNANTGSVTLARTYDSILPVAQLTSVASDPTNADPIVVTASFSEAVSGFALGDLTPTNGVVSNLVNITPGQVWTFDLNPSGIGLVQVSLAATAATDAAGNGNGGPVVFSRTFNASGPLAQLLSFASDPTNLSSIQVTASFSAPVSGLTLADLTATNGVVSNLVEVVASQVWTFDLTPAADGACQVSLAAGAVTDAAGNGNPGPIVFGRAYDGTQPAAQLLCAASDPTALTPISMQASFSETVSGFQLSDLALVNGGASNLVEQVAGRVWSFDLTPSGLGTVQVTLPADAALDSADNGSLGPVTVTRVFDNAGPTFVFGPPASNPTNLALIPVSLTFNEEVTGLATGDFVMVNGSVTSLSPSSGTQIWSLSVAPVGDGVTSVDLPVGAATDFAGNGNSAGTAYSVTSDRSQPSVAITSTAPNPASGSFLVNVAFSEPVAGFAAGDLTVLNGTVNSFVETVASQSWDVGILPTSPGTVSIGVPANAASDGADNGNAAAVYSHPYDPTPPSVMLLTGFGNPVTVATFTVTASFSEDVTGFALADLTTANAVVTNLVAITGSREFQFDVSPTVPGSFEVGLPANVVLDAAFLPNNAAASISRTFDPPQYITTLAGYDYQPAATVDGNGSNARFNAPGGITQDSAGNLFIADSTGEVIRKVDPSNNVTVFAGNGVSGHQDGVGVAAGFNHPTAMAIDGADNLYVADTNSHCIRRIAPDGTVTTIAGIANGAGSTDGALGVGRLNFPRGVHWDLASGVLYIADSGNNTIRKLEAGFLSTVAGGVGVAGLVDGASSTARFNNPQGLVLMWDWALFVADTDNHAVRIVDLANDGQVITQGGDGTPGHSDGASPTVLLNQPVAFAAVSTSTSFFYVVDSGNKVIRGFQGDGVVFSTECGLAGTAGWADGGSTRFSKPMGMVGNATGQFFITDEGNHNLLRLDTDVVMTTHLAGVIPHADGAGATARFFSPGGAVVDGSGNVYVSDTNNHCIRMVTSAGVVSTLAGIPGRSGHNDGPGGTAQFYLPRGLTLDPTTGDLYVADSGNHVIRKVIPATGLTSTVAGMIGSPGMANYPGQTMFNNPTDIVADSSGNLYVADTDNTVIRQLLVVSYQSSTFAGIAGSFGSADGPGNTATFNQPRGIAIDASNTLYVTDWGNSTIRKIATDTTVTTLAGLAGTSGHFDAAGSFARFNTPWGIDVTPSGMILVTERVNQDIRQIAAGAVVTTVAGTAGVFGFADGLGIAAKFWEPQGITVGPDNAYYIADGENHRIRRGSP